MNQEDREREVGEEKGQKKRVRGIGEGELDYIETKVWWNKREWEREREKNRERIKWIKVKRSEKERERERENRGVQRENSEKLKRERQRDKGNERGGQ